MTEPVKLPEVKIVHLWQTTAFWTNVASMAVSLAALALTMLNQLGLSSIWLLVWTLVLTAIVNGANIYLKYQSNAVVGDKQQVRAFEGGAEFTAAADRPA